MQKTELIVREETDPQSWNQQLATLPQPQLLQTWQWGELKSRYGWRPFHKSWQQDGRLAAAALVLERAVRLPVLGLELRLHYTPKGPLLRHWSDAGLRQRVIADLVEFARQRRAYALKIDPDVPVGMGVPGEEGAREGLVGVEFLSELKSAGWRYSPEQIQFQNTVLIDLQDDEDQMLGRMKQKTRYNVRLAERKGETVRQGTPADFDELYHMYAETAVRDGFTIRGGEYYLDVWQTFFQAGLLTPLIAEVEGQAVAGLMLFHFGAMAWYLYGMSRPLHREKMPTYLLQWEAMRVAKARGCTTYDLWGAPQEFSQDDPLWGIYRFKSGLGGTVARHIGAWDLPLRPLVYRMHTQLWPRLIELMRRRGDARTRQQAGGDIE